MRFTYNDVAQALHGLMRALRDEELQDLNDALHELREVERRVGIWRAEIEQKIAHQKHQELRAIVPPGERAP